MCRFPFRCLSEAARLTKEATIFEIGKKSYHYQGCLGRFYGIRFL